MAMNATPKAQPPSTMCHQKGTANHGLVAEPMALKAIAMAAVPATQPAIVRHEPTLRHHEEDRAEEAGERRGLAEAARSRGR